VEAAQRLRSMGALTVAITADPASRLALAAEAVIDVAASATADSGAARGYAAALLAAWLLGIRIAEIRLRVTMDEANTRRALLIHQADRIERSIPASAATCRHAAERWKACHIADLLGSGPALGSAQFAAAKLIEAAGIHATAQDLEEFHHLNYFIARPADLPTVLFTAAASAAASRAQELAATLQVLGRPTLLISDTDATAAQNVLHLKLPATSEAAWSDAAATMPFHDHAGPWRGARDAGLVRNSSILSRHDTMGGNS
jgi:glucosamine--fructose-6-phosphate aminotransferase (isomerizing)